MEDEYRLARIIEPGEGVKAQYNCSRVSGMDKCGMYIMLCASGNALSDGILLICTRNVYMIDNYRIEPSGEIIEISAAETSGVCYNHIAYLRHLTNTQPQPITKRPRSHTQTRQQVDDTEFDLAVSGHTVRKWLVALL